MRGQWIGLVTGAAMATVALCGPAAAAPAATAWRLFSAQDAKSAPPAERGAVVFQNSCEICHGAGADRPGTMSLGFKYGSSKPARLEQRRDLTPDVVKYFVRHGVGMMPFFRKTELSDPDLDALAAYLGSAKH